MTDSSINIGRQGAIPIDQGLGTPKPSTGDESLDSITHSKPGDTGTPPPSPRESGGVSPQQALQTVVGMVAEQDGGEIDQPPPPVPARAIGVSPFSGDRGALAPDTPTPMADKTLPADWAERMTSHAEGTSGHVWVGSHQTAIRAMMTEFTQAAARGQGEGDMRSIEIAKSLSAILGQEYTAERVGSDGVKPLRQAHMAIVSLVQHARSSPTSPEDVLRAVLMLPLDQRHTLLEADLAGTKALTGLLYEATQPPGQLTAGPKALFTTFKAASSLAELTLRLDRSDPTGTASASLQGFVEHLEGIGVTSGTMDAFARHLAFQATLGDLQMPDTSRANWKQDFTADLVSRFAALEDRQPGELNALLQLPKPDLLELLGHAMGNRMEGDVHILRALRDDMPALKALFGDEGQAFEDVFKGLESGAYDATLFTSEIRNGSDLATLRTALESRLDERVTLATGTFRTKAQATADYSAARLQVLVLRAADHPAPTGNALGRITSEISELRAFMREFNTAFDPEAINGKLTELTAEKDGGPQGLPSPATGDRLLAINSQIAALTTLRDELAVESGTGFEFEKAAMLDLGRRFGTDALERVEFGTGSGPNNDSSRMSVNSSIDSFRQLRFHAQALNHPEHYKAGLQNLSPVLPTFGKDLESFHHIDSMVQGLVSVADEIRKADDAFSLAGTPIIVLDQTDGDGTNPGRVGLWNRNDAYLKGLNDTYGDSHGLNIVHVRMQDITRMITGSGVEKLFDTTRQGNAGYGGARNMAFMLGPVIRDAVMKGQSLDSITPENLVARIKAQALTDDAPKLFMGDDTDYLGPGAMFSKIGVNALHKDEYYTAVSRRDGRDTTAVASMIATGVTGNLDSQGAGSLNGAFANSAFNPRLVTPGMGSVTGAPRFCFDVPTGAEESHHKGLANYKDQLGIVRHLSGDRMRDAPGQVEGFLNYAIGTETFVQFGAILSTWNSGYLGDVLSGRDGFTSLGDVVRNASEPENVAANTRDAMHRLAGWATRTSHGDGPRSVRQSEIDKIDTYLEAHPRLDSESRAELLKVKSTFENAIRQGVLAENLINDLVRRLAPEAVEIVDGKIEVRFSLEETARAAKPQEVLAQALSRAVDDGVDIGAQLDLAKLAVLGDVDLAAANNQIIRNLVLVLESIPGGGFADLMQKLR